MTAAPVELKHRWSWPAVLIAIGAVVVVGALIASGFAARAALTSARVLTSPPSSPLALEFAPPDYTDLWVCLAIAGFGAVAVVVGIAAAISKRRRA